MWRATKMTSEKGRILLARSPVVDSAIQGLIFHFIFLSSMKLIAALREDRVASTCSQRRAVCFNDESLLKCGKGL
jgi:hypothetical protein